LSQELDKLHQPYDPNIEIGIMIEVPSAVMMADAMADEVDFFSIGTNDLVQYALALDRNNKEVAHLYQPLHPAILRMLKHVKEVGKKKGIRVSICGEMAGDPIHIPILLGLGFDALSMNPKSIPAVKHMIRSMRADDARRFMKDVLLEKTTKDILQALFHQFGDTLNPPGP
jgi:phosphotransferase system enzyme I (PtsI)